MRIVVSYLRFLTISAAALALSACAGIKQSDPTMFATEPKLGDPPKGEITQVVAKPVTIEEVEAQLSALDAQIVNLKHALEIMRPSVKTSEIAISAGRPDLYAPAPDLPQARSLFSWADSCTSFAAPAPCAPEPANEIEAR
jgi:hypothetical protein